MYFLVIYQILLPKKKGRKNYLTIDSLLVRTVVPKTLPRTAVEMAWWLINHDNCPGAEGSAIGDSEGWKRSLAFERHGLCWMGPKVLMEVPRGWKALYRDWPGKRE